MADTSGNIYGLYRSDRGYFTTGNTANTNLLVYPIQEGAGVQFPDKYLDVPGAANNVYDYSYYDGLYYPTVRMPVDVMASWFTAANLNSLFLYRDPTRGERGYDDLNQIAGDPVFSDGFRAIQLTKAKGAMLSVSTRQGDIIRANLGIMGAGYLPVPWAAVTPPPGKRASWSNLVVISGVSGVVDLSLSVDTACQPTPICGDGTGTGVVEINAGKPRFTLTLVVDAAGTYPQMGVPIVFTITPPTVSGAPGVPVTFTLPNPRINQPDNLEKRPRRASQSFTVIGQSVDGVTPGLTVQ